MSVDTGELIRLIEDQPESENWIYQMDGEWRVTNEWLCGVFAGRGFGAPDREAAAARLAAYLSDHLGHDSIVGRSVTESGWPDLGAVRRFLEYERAEDDE